MFFRKVSLSRPRSLSSFHLLYSPRTCFLASALALSLPLSRSSSLFNFSLGSVISRYSPSSYSLSVDNLFISPKKGLLSSSLFSPFLSLPSPPFSPDFPTSQLILSFLFSLLLPFFLHSFDFLNYSFHYFCTLSLGFLYL